MTQYSIDRGGASVIASRHRAVGTSHRGGRPHHVIQRGNRRQQVFFGDGDYAPYRRLVAEGCRTVGVKVWAYCFMPNHVHLILVPPRAAGPLGSARFLARLEKRLHRPLARRKPGPKAKADEAPA